MGLLKARPCGGRDPRLSQSARNSHRRSDAAPQRRRAGGRGDPPGEFRAVRILDAGGLAGADRHSQGVRRIRRKIEIGLADAGAVRLKPRHYVLKTVRRVTLMTTTTLPTYADV